MRDVHSELFLARALAAETSGRSAEAEDFLAAAIGKELSPGVAARSDFIPEEEETWIF